MALRPPPVADAILLGGVLTLAILVSRLILQVIA